MVYSVLGPTATVVTQTNLLRFTPAADEGQPGGTIAYRLRYVPDTGDKVWGPADYSLTPVVLTFQAGPIVNGKRQYNLKDYPELVALSGTYDIAVTSIDAAGNESAFLELENAVFNFS